MVGVLSSFGGDVKKAVPCRTLDIDFSNFQFSNIKNIFGAHVKSRKGVGAWLEIECKYADLK